MKEWTINSKFSNFSNFLFRTPNSKVSDGYKNLSDLKHRWNIEKSIIKS